MLWVSVVCEVLPVKFLITITYFSSIHRAKVLSFSVEYTNYHQLLMYVASEEFYFSGVVSFWVQSQWFAELLGPAVGSLSRPCVAGNGLKDWTV